MNKELIEEIEDLRDKAKEMQDIAFLNDKIELHSWEYCRWLNQGIVYNKVLEILEFHKPKILDKPDSNGWWWNNAIGDWRACRVHEGSGINGNDWDYPIWADGKGVKWIKAVVPESEEK